ncbi:(d)CMP kinase [Ruficoccus amylovorans]|uniref:Cytidylate kinase n=1 Tax=Ruficoccus amylovorans TaxID=1804625 RepID=A0A842HEU0_9BACT|nr:(d)CMP kinase [Ruficoccus amylovorans]MBC2595115.1 (d)CMP kinase [Ruficoccus amylovorans]
MTQTPVIAVDGGAASGKSSTSRRLAARFNLMHVDTGSHYRAVTFALVQAGVSPGDAAAIQSHLKGLKLGEQIDGQSARICIDGQVPREEDIRSEAVNAAVSPFAAVPEVRQFLYQYQRSQAAVAARAGFNGLIMEGRDIGSVIFPDAPLRFFLEADEATRAARRAREGQTDSIAERDRIDSSRKTAPLRCPEGAQRVDTSHLTLDEVVDLLAEAIEQTTGLSPVVA